MKLFGHPLHLIFVHFPSALLPMDVVCSAIAYFANVHEAAISSFYASAGAVAGGWLSVFTGALDLLPVAEKKAGLINKVLLHGSINTVVLIVYTLIFIRAYRIYPSINTDTGAILLAKIILVILMGAGNFLGGRLVLREKIGMEENN
jgi:uncharacterized membrane protein